MPMQGIPISAEQSKTIGKPVFISHLYGTLPNEIETDTSAGGSATQETGRTVLSTDATAGEHAAIFQRALASNVSSGTVTIWLLFSNDSGAGGLDESHEIGMTVQGSEDSNNIAVFRPSVGDSTSGNIRVDNGGTDTDGSLDYPTLDGNFHMFAIQVDTDAGQTRFYVDRDPLEDKANETLDAIPNLMRSPGFQIFSNESDATEELWCRMIMTQYVP